MARQRLAQRPQQYTDEAEVAKGHGPTLADTVLAPRRKAVTRVLARDVYGDGKHRRADARNAIDLGKANAAKPAAAGTFSNTDKADFAVSVGNGLPTLPIEKRLATQRFATLGLIASVVVILCGTSPRGALAAEGDFNGDHIADLAIAAVVEGLEGVPGGKRAGSINVIYGSPLGLTSTRNQILFQSGCLPGQPHFEEGLGEALAVGNFDGDEFADLAIGVPRDNSSGVGGAGAVNVIYGSPSGLACTRTQIWHQGSPGIQGVPEQGDHLGYALAAGNFGGDGRDELAIGVPGEAIGDKDRAGVVQVLRGSSAGLTNADQLWHQDVEGIAGAAEATDLFGRALVARNMGNGGYEDLAIGAPGEDIGDVVAAGAVAVLYGSSNGLTSVGDELWHQGSESVHDDPEASDRFGLSLAAADVGVGFNADLVIGVPGESISGRPRAGAVAVLYDGAAGLTGVGDQLLSQDEFKIDEQAAEDDHFGSAVATANFDADDMADLAVGVPEEDVGSTTDAGGINVIYGSRSGGLLSRGNHFESGVGDAAAPSEHAGASLAAGNFGRAVQSDLAIGAIGERVQGIRSGAVAVLYGGTTKLGDGGREQWHQAKPGILGTPEPGDFFGWTLASG
jgi:FG-GAP repeat